MGIDAINPVGITQLCICVTPNDDDEVPTIRWNFTGADNPAPANHPQVVVPYNW